MKVNKKQFLESIIDRVIDKVIASINKERKRKKKDIINLKDPKARKIVNKYRKQIEKSADKIMSL
tara:strand:+ start:248 stop:442 length:195 start_codon:yes stop_codon:yes gene_type:complete